MLFLWSLSKFIKPLMRVCQLGTQVEPGYSIFYWFSKILGLFLVGLVVYMIVGYPLLQNQQYEFISRMYIEILNFEYVQETSSNIDRTSSP